MWNTLEPALGGENASTTSLAYQRENWNRDLRAFHVEHLEYRNCRNRWLPGFEVVPRGTKSRSRDAGATVPRGTGRE
jgi:hypothetical protein